MRTVRADLTEQVRKELGLGDERTGDLSVEDALPVLRRLAADVDSGQRAIGMVLWHLDPNPAELLKYAEELSVKIGTLKSWLNTYSRLRHDAELAMEKFSKQQQLARIMNAEDRAELWESRPAGEWTLPALTAAVDGYMERIGSSVLAKIRKAGMKGRYNERELKVNLELFKSAVKLRLTVSEETELSNLVFDEVSDGVYEITLDW